MGRAALGLSPISFTPPHRGERPDIQRTDNALPTELRIGPTFALSAGTLDRPLQHRSPWGTVFSVSMHLGALLLVLALLPKYTKIDLPQVPDMWAFIVPALPAASPPPGPPPPKVKAESPAEEPKPQPPPEAAVIPIEAATGIAPETGLLASTPAPTAGWGVEGGVSWGGGSGSGILANIPTPPPAPAPAPVEPIRVGGDITEPSLIQRVSPVYPEIAVQAMLEGIVILEATVDAAGNVESVTVLRSRGALLDRAAVDAVRQWRYSPLIYHGKPHPFILTVTVSFSLEKPGQRR